MIQETLQDDYFTTKLEKTRMYPKSFFGKVDPEDDQDCFLYVITEMPVDEDGEEMVDNQWQGRLRYLMNYIK